MAKYSDIKGFTVQTLSSDPGATQFAAGSWASDAPAPQATQSAGSFGTSTAAVSSGGYDGTAYIQTTIEFNGSSWSSGGSMNRPAGQNFPGFGTEPSGGIAGGYKTSGNAVVNNFESYNGTAFTESTDLNSARQAAGATGASATAGIVVGGTTGVGSPPDTTGNNNVEIWNGSSWTEISEINTARYSLRALGSTCPAPTAVVAGGENSGTKTGATEKYDGSSWSESGDLNTARSQHGGAGSVATSGICFGGEGSAPSYTNYALTEHFDGSTWTEVSDLSGTRYAFGTMTGTGSAAIAAQGRNPGYTGLTEIWSAPSTFQKTTEGQLYFNSTTNTFKETISDIPAGVWSSGGNINTARKASAGAGELTTTLIFGGTLNPPTTLGETELYNGSSWTEVADLSTDRAYHGGSGTSTAALSTGGSTTGDSPITPSALNENWDGSSWTEVADINTARVFCPLFGGPGTTTAAILADGYTPSPPNNNNADAIESWNGSSWSEVAELNSPRRASGTFGVTTAAIVAGGYVSSPNGNVEEWDGSAFTEVADLNTARVLYGNGFGTSTLGVVAGGASGSSYYGITEVWNGSSWTEVNDMATGRSETGNSSSSSAVSGLVAGGRESSPGAGINSTEEWTANLANKTITAS